MKIHFVQHETFEAPGAYLLWAQDRGYEISFSKVFNGDVIPKTVMDIDMLIILGGPQDPNTDIKKCSYFNAAEEQTLISDAISNGKAVVGVCLGAQLIGEALGARFQKSPEKEIGVFPLIISEEGLVDELISHFGKHPMVGHWHNDMPGLNTNSKVLASSKGCPRQIVRYTDLVYAFQCHMEFNIEVVKLLIDQEIDFFQTNTTYPYVQNSEEILNYDYEPMNTMLYIFLDKLTSRYMTKNRKITV